MRRTRARVHATSLARAASPPRARAAQTAEAGSPGSAEAWSRATWRAFFFGARTGSEAGTAGASGAPRAAIHTTRPAARLSAAAAALDPRTPRAGRRTNAVPSAPRNAPAELAAYKAPPV